MHEHLKLRHVGNMDFTDSDSLRVHNPISRLIVSTIDRFIDYQNSRCSPTLAAILRLT